MKITKVNRAYCQNCGTELTSKGGDLINNSLYCSFDKTECGRIELERIFGENLCFYELINENCNSRLIETLGPFDIQQKIKEDLRNYSLPLFLSR